MATDDDNDSARKDEDHKQWPCGGPVKDSSVP